MNRNPTSRILSGFATILLVLALLAVGLTPMSAAAVGRAGSWRMEKGRT
jgi:nitrate/nitrite-specific signal transduction histidine kinase